MNRTQSDQYWYNEGRKVGRVETINKMLETIDQELENLHLLAWAYQKNLKRVIAAMKEDETLEGDKGCDNEMPKVGCGKTPCNNCINHGFCDYELGDKQEDKAE